MSNPWYTIIELLSTTSRKAKEEIISYQSALDNTVFFRGLWYAMSPYHTFGVKDITNKFENEGEGLEWKEFEDVLIALKNRSITGYAAQDEIRRIKQKASKDEWNYWYVLILNRNMRLGITEQSINKIVKKEHSIPVFGCQLAHDATKFTERLKGKKIIDLKLDGIRCLASLDTNGFVSMYSRNGKYLDFPEIAAEIKNTLARGYVYDGEIISNSFNQLMTQVNRKYNKNTDDAVFHVFDIIPIENFKNGFYSVPQIVRKRQLKSYVNNSRINVIDYIEVDLDTESGYNDYIQMNQRAINFGYEGIMIKDPNAPYEIKRTMSWLKQKPFIEVTLTASSMEEGKGKAAGMMGNVNCEGYDGEKFIEVSVGGGFTDIQRINFWNNPDSVIGHSLEIRADAITQNENGSYSLRFPRFKSFRTIEKGEQL